MPPAISYLANRLALAGAAARPGLAGMALIIGLHAAAMALLVATESDTAAKAAFLLFWGLLNCFWLVVLRRPAAAAGLSLALLVWLILLSRLKHSALFMTVNFVDLMIIDSDTFVFLFHVIPNLGWVTALTVLLVIAVLIAIFLVDRVRVRWRTALLGAAVCLAALTALAYAVPSDPYDEFNRHQYVSKFARSGSTAVTDYFRFGLLDSDATVSERLGAASDEACKPAQRPPNIIMLLDESSFDLSIASGVKVPAGYQQHFRSFDGKARSFVVEGAGGPSWFTEYNVLTGLSARSYGRFADFVTRISAGHVERGFPRALRRCGYKTFSFYPFFGAFLSARSFQIKAGIEYFLDAKDLGTRGVEQDRFFYDAAASVIARERGTAPLFLFVYTTANHFPWTYRFRPELMPEWHDPGNGSEADEYLRRQALSARDYGEFVARLKREFPQEAFLLVRFGDHQPGFARHLLDPSLDDSFLARRIAEHDPRFLTTYYAIDAVNFRPADLSSALDTLDAPYLPIVIMEAAGLPLDPSFAEQRKILQRCRGLFHRCAGGAEARRFNRLLIDAGLIKGL